MPQQQLVSHINHAIPAYAHTQMYLIHKWWARKPHNVVSEYIKYYSKEGDIVLDPFCGSGVTPIEAIKLGRKAIGVDLNPMSIFVTRMTAIPANIDAIKKTFDEISQSISKQILEYYVTKCPKCNNKSFEICAIWKEGSQLPEEIRFYCTHCEKYIHKKPDDDDVQKIQKIQKLPIKNWHPTNILKYKNGQDFREGTHQPDLEDIPSYSHIGIFCRYP